MQNLMHAHRQWATRPDDERFSNLEALQNAVDYRKHASEELPRYLGDVWAVASGDDVVLDGLDRQLSFTHWSFKQFCSRLGAPAHYLRDLPAELVARNLNVGIERHSSTSAMVYAQQERVRAFTSRRYGRIYDSDVVEWVRRATAGTSWKQPLANPPGRFGPPGSDAEPGGLYASDRDCFLFLVDEERRVEVGSESLARGFCVWNSEVGAATFGVLTFLYRFVCGNLIIWNAEQVSEVKIRHVGDHAAQRAFAQLEDALGAYRELDTAAERAVISSAMEKSVAKDREEAESFLTSRGFKRDVARDSVTLAEVEEGGAGTLWELTQGVTAYARSIPYRNERVALERQAGKLLQLA